MTTSQLKANLVKVINNLTDQIAQLNEYNGMGLLMPEEYTHNLNRLLRNREATRRDLQLYCS